MLLARVHSYARGRRCCRSLLRKLVSAPTCPRPAPGCGAKVAHLRLRCLACSGDARRNRQRPGQHPAGADQLRPLLPSCLLLRAVGLGLPISNYKCCNFDQLQYHCCKISMCFEGRVTRGPDLAADQDRRPQRMPLPAVVPERA